MKLVSLSRFYVKPTNVEVFSLVDTNIFNMVNGIQHGDSEKSKQPVHRRKIQITKPNPEIQNILKFKLNPQKFSLMLN